MHDELGTNEPIEFSGTQSMTLDEKVNKLLAEDEHVAYLLLCDECSSHDGHGDWREIPQEFRKALQHFRETFEKLITRISKRYGNPSYIEREWSRNSPCFAPMGLYADWITNDEGDVICVFLGGDGNPEDPLMLLAGRTTCEAKADRSGMDPWDWKWIE